MKEILTGLALCFALTVASGQSDSLQLLDFIRTEGMENSQVEMIASSLTDIYGPRLTGSPMLDRATQWASDQLGQWGMKNVHLEEWGPFGKGWQLEHFEMHMQEPSYSPLIAYPKAWSPSTGEVSGEVIYLSASNAEELEQFRGQLEGKFILLDTIRKLEEWFEPPSSRLDAEALLDVANAGEPTPRRFRNFRRSGANFSTALWQFFFEEKPAAVIDRSYKGDLGTVFLSQARASGRSSRNTDEVVPQITMAIEHYNRIFRLYNAGIPIELTVDFQASFHNPDEMEHNIIAEIPGSDLADQVVMLGAHFDSWHTATGATDNAAGSTVMMEAARILQKAFQESGTMPRRTIRLALWTGEEQGLLGSKAYVGEHFAQTDQFGNALEMKPEQEKVSAYYNLDNGTGKIRGIYLQGNEGVRGIFREWLDPFADLEASTITASNTGGTDHLAFDAVGIPGFQFLQDPISYGTRTHHSNMDHFDHLVLDDLKQAATIVATFVYRTAQRDAMLPRKEVNN